jgi:hypothetical protein
LHFKGGQERLNDALVNKGGELREGGTGGAVADSPHGLFLDLVVVQEKDLNKFVNDTEIQADLDLID